MKFKLPRSSHNWITLIGAMIAFISFSMIVFLFTISVFWRDTHAYLGLVIYILLPAVMLLGLLLIPVGMLIETRRRQRAVDPDQPAWPRVDLNIVRHRNAFMVFSIGTSLLLFISAVGSYEAFHYTESVTFCGTVCHKVMHPEFTAYQNSAHARVSCVDCHVGTGADWYVRSKLSGLYQVYSSLADKYPRPIATPIANLRPARETCENCHWPSKFYAQKLHQQSHYLSDEENTQWDIQLLMKTGAMNSDHGLKEGIHWHINPDVKIEYIASDESREEIVWVRYTNLKTGEETIYTDEESDVDIDSLQQMATRLMDCMDCHNRPSHIYQTPAKFVNVAINTGAIPVELPEIKMIAVELCDQEFTNNDSAMQEIARTINDYYEEEYPDLYEEKKELIAQAILGMQEAFSKNIFPEMKVRWDAYPDHIGHKDFNGCFRCHNNTHISESGKSISMDCNLCHLITAQGSPDEMAYAETGNGLEFIHPDGDEDWREGLCTDCHTGLNP